MLGAAVLLIALAAWVQLVIRERSNAATLEPRYRTVYVAHVVAGHLATVPFIVAGAAVLALCSAPIGWTVPGSIFAFLDTAYLGGCCLIEINR